MPGQRKKPKKRPVTAPASPRGTPKLPTGVGDDLIPVDLLLRYNTFVEHYLNTLDSCEAVVAAKFADAGEARVRKAAYASRLLRNPYIRTRIENQYRSIIAKTGATVERVWEEIAYAAFCDPRRAYGPDGAPLPMNEIPEDVARAITGRKKVVKTFGEDGSSEEEEIKFAGKDAALEKLIRLHKMTDNDKYVLVNGEEFLAAMNEGRERAGKRE